jgi:urea transport system permease protein
VLGALLVNLGKTLFTGLLPELWLYALGLLFILTTLFLPRGVAGVWRAAKPMPVAEVTPEMTSVDGEAAP